MRFISIQHGIRLFFIGTPAKNIGSKAKWVNE